MDAIEISPRAADSVRQMLEQLEKLPKTIQTYINALAAQLDVPDGWRFDQESMAFLPPTEQSLPADER